VNGTDYLVTDFSIHCGDERWNAYLVYAIIMTILYPLMIPVMFGYLLNKNHSAGLMNDIRTRMSLGFLYQVTISCRLIVMIALTISLIHHVCVCVSIIIIGVS
jgi:hypothetical protein